MTAPAVETVAPAPVVAPVVPAVAPVPAPVVAPVAEPVAPAKPEGPLTRREAQQRMVEKMKGRATPAEAAAPVVDAAAPVAAPTGPVLDVAPVALPAAAAPAEPQPVRVPIPAGHPMREMGVESLTANSPQEERALRAALNSYVRRNEVTTLQAQLQQLQAEKVERDGREAARKAWQADPKYAATMARAQEIRETYGDADAEQFLRGLNADFDQMAKQEIDQRMGQVRAQEVERATEAWTQEAWQNASALPESIRTIPVFGQAFQDAVHSFNAELELGHFPQVQTAEQAHKAFMQFFNTRLTALPEVVAVYRSLGARQEQARTAAAAKAAEEQRRIDKIKQDAVEEYKRIEGEKRGQAAPPHPLGNLAAAAPRVPAVAGSEAAVPAANVPVNQLRRDGRAAAAQRARERFGMTGT